MRSSSTRVDSSRAPHLANGRPLGPWRSACGLLLTLTCLPSSTGPGTYDGAFTKYEHMDDGTWEKRGTRTKKDVENLVGCALRSAAPPQPVSRSSGCACASSPTCTEEEPAHVAAQERRVWVPGHYAWPHACIRRRSLRHQAGAEGERGRRECPPAVQVCVGTSCNARHARALCHCCVVGTSHRVACVLALRCMPM